VRVLGLSSDEGQQHAKRRWTWILGGMAVLFNPILPIRIHRTDWQIVDALGAATLFVFVAVYKPDSYSKP